MGVRDEEGCESLTSFNIRSDVSLTNDIMPIIEANCASTTCHGSVQSPRLNSKEAVISNASRIRSRTRAGTMPPSSREPLSQSEIDRIGCWVDDGALNN